MFAGSPMGQPSAIAPNGPTGSPKPITAGRRIASIWLRSRPWAGFDRTASPVGSSFYTEMRIESNRVESSRRRPRHAASEESSQSSQRSVAGLFHLEEIDDRLVKGLRGCRALRVVPGQIRHARPSGRGGTGCTSVFRSRAEQRGLLGGFARRMPVLCLAGAWCGDCVNQCPVFDHFAGASATIDLRFLDRDAQPELRDALAINGGHRVPVLVFLSEDWFEVSRYGERTLSIYRRLAADQLGPACPTGLVPPADEAIAVSTAEWLAEFEAPQLILRLSPRLRGKHGD